MRNLIIFGDTSFAERLSLYIEAEKIDKVIGFTQEKQFISRKEINGLPIIPFEELNNKCSNFEIIIGIGYSNMNKLRAHIFDICKNKYKIGSYISSKAIVYTSNIEEGVFIMPCVHIGPGCKIGKGCIFEAAAILTHDITVGNFNYFSANVTVGGHATIGNNCFIGLNATIKNSISIEDFTLVGASANCVKTIEKSGGVIYGNPAKLIDEKDPFSLII